MPARPGCNAAGKASERIATVPHIRMECSDAAGTNTALPGGIIHERRSAWTDIAPADAYTS